MLITLTPEQETWLQARVTAGNFASLEEAARQLIDERILEIAAEDSDDLDWAKPHIDEARDAVGRGDCVFLEEHETHNAALPASFKD